MSKFSGLGLAVEVPSRMTILHPVTRQPLRNALGEETYIDLLSASSSVARAHDRVTTDARIKMGNRRISAEEIEASINERLALLTRDWSLATLDGDPIDVPYSAANARELYALPELSWLRDQALEFSGDVGNFRKGASQS